jgi:hypothetical protein
MDARSTNSSFSGLFSIFCSKLSARICFASSRCFSCSDGAAVELGRMLPKTPPPKKRQQEPMYSHSEQQSL